VRKRVGIRGIGFKTADAVAMKLGTEKTAMIRARAGISFALTEALDEGHCGLPRDDLLPLAVKLLEIPGAIVTDALRFELEAGQVIADGVEGRDCIFLTGLYRAERAIADRLHILLRGSMPWEPIDAEKAIPWVEPRTGLSLAGSQKTAMRASSGSSARVSAIASIHRSAGVSALSERAASADVNAEPILHQACAGTPQLRNVVIRNGRIRQAERRRTLPKPIRQRSRFRRSAIDRLIDAAGAVQRHTHAARSGVAAARGGIMPLEGGAHINLSR